LPRDRSIRQALAGTVIDGGTDLQEEATMSIASIAGGSAWSHQLTGSNAMANLMAAAPKAATGTPSPANSGSLMQDIVSTLQHLAFPGSAGGAAAAVSATAASAPAATSAAKSAQDLQSFMATLIQALHQAGGQGSQSTQSTQGGRGMHGGHGHVSTQLQSLVQEIDGGSGTGTAPAAAGSSAPAVSGLETSFQSLMQDLSSGAAAGTAASASGTPSLQGFLQSLLTSLQTQGTTQSAGLLIHATA
jgi:hypothetical protein